jgi:hypothetical protein
VQGKANFIVASELSLHLQFDSQRFLKFQKFCILFNVFSYWVCIEYLPANVKQPTINQSINLLHISNWILKKYWNYSS